MAAGVEDAASEVGQQETDGLLHSREIVNPVRHPPRPFIETTIRLVPQWSRGTILLWEETWQTADTK
jgi:hypothetical protein